MASPKLFFYKGLRADPCVSRMIEKHPSLDPETERSLLLAAQSGDIEARQTLIKHNLAFVCKVGGVYRQDQFKCLPLDDSLLLHQGIIGLNRAIDEWSPNGGARLQTFAYWRVRNEMQSDTGLYRNDIIRVPESARLQLRKVNETIDKHEGPLTPAEIAEQTQINVKRVETLLQVQQPISLNKLVDDSKTELVDRVADPASELVSNMDDMLSALPLEMAEVVQQNRLGEIIQRLPSTLAEVIHLHFFEGATFKVISKQLLIPVNQVGALVREGIESLRNHLLHCYPSCDYIPPQPAIEPMGEGEQLALELPAIVEKGRKLVTRGLGFGIQLVKQTKRAVKKVAEVLTNPLKVFAQSQALQPESATPPDTTPRGAGDSPSESTPDLSCSTTRNNIVDFKCSYAKGVVSLDFYTQKVFDSGGTCA